MSNVIREVHAVAHHRNGVCGVPFYVVTFTDQENGDAMIATVFPESGAVAVLSMGLLAEGCIEFGRNSFRGDHFERELRAAIAAYEAGRASIDTSAVEVYVVG